MIPNPWIQLQFFSANHLAGMSPGKVISCQTIENINCLGFCIDSRTAVAKTQLQDNYI